MNFFDIIVSFKKFLLDILKFDSFALTISMIVTYLINPDAVTYSVAILMCLDLITRLYANSVKAGGFIKAIKTRQITSEVLMRRTFAKIVRNVTLMIIANQAKNVFVISFIGASIHSLIYGLMWLGEAISNIENLMEAGWSDLDLLLSAFKKKQKTLVDTLTANMVNTTPVPVSPPITSVDHPAKGDPDEKGGI